MDSVIKSIPSLSEDLVASHELKHKAFLSHEGAEKRTIVHLLRGELRGHGIPNQEVFYDEYVTPGGNRDEELENRLKYGLLASEYLVVFLTPAFLKKRWPLWELRTFLDIMEKDRRRKLLPVFYKLSAEECGDIVELGRTIMEKGKGLVELSRDSEELRYVLGKVKKQVGIDAEGQRFTDADVVIRIMKAVFGVNISSDKITVSAHQEAHDAATCGKPLCEHPVCADAIKWDLKKFFAVPPLPSYTRLDFDENSERPEKILRDKVLLQGSNAIAAAGVKGMGGAGKTTCLIGVANNDQVREAFRDGILWIQLSKETKVEEKMREVFVNILKYSWYYWEGRKPEAALNPRTSLDQIVKNAGEALKEKRCLIVLDDFWTFDDYKRSIDCFKKILSKSSRILLSTRYGDVVRGFNADQTDVGDLGDETASALFDDWCGESPAGEKQENLKKEILELCSNLALAVCIAGSNVREIAKLEGSKERGLERVLKKLKQNIDGLQGLDHTRDDQMLKAVIQTTIDTMTDENHKNAYRFLAVFSNKTRIPNQALEALWGVDAEFVEDRINLYIACSLATRKVVFKPGGLSSLYVEFHDQHLAYARYIWCLTKGKRKAGNSCRLSEEEKMLSGLHAELVDGYEALHQDANARVWWEAKELDDGYFHDHYVHHLAKSGRMEDLLELLTDYRWIAMRCRRQEIRGLLRDFDVVISTLETCQTPKGLNKKRIDLKEGPAGPHEATNADDSGAPHERALEALLLVQKALRASQATLWERRDEIPFQLVGRLLMHSKESAFIKKVIDGARQWEEGAWLCPVRQCFESPISGAFQVLHSKSRVMSVAVLPEKHHLVAYGTVDGDLRMWDWSAGRTVWSRKAHEGSIWSLAVKKDGSVMVSGSSDKTVRLWNVNSGECRRVLRGHRCSVWSVAVTEDGTTVVSGSRDKTIRLWDVASGECKKVLRGYHWAMTSVAVTEDESVLVSGSRDMTIRLWDVESGELKRVLQDHDRGVTSVAATEDRGVMVSGSDDTTIRLWDTKSGECRKVLRGHDRGVTSVAVTEDGGVVVSGSDDNTVRLWNVQSGCCKRVLRGHESWVSSVAVTEYGAVVVSGSDDNTVRLWDVGSKECKSELGGHEDQVKLVSVTEDASTVVSGSDDNTVRLWDLESGKCRIVLRGHEGCVNSVAVTEDGSVVVSGSDDNTVRLWDVESGESRRVLRGHECWVNSVAVTEDGNVVVSGSGDKTVRLWDAGSGECRRVLREHDRAVRSVAVAEDGSVVVSGSDDGTVRLWDVESGKCKRVLRGHDRAVTSVAVTEDGSFVVSRSYDKTTRLWNVESGECSKTAGWAMGSLIMFGSRDLLRWARSVGILKTRSESDFRCSGKWSLLPASNAIEVESCSGVVKIAHIEDARSIVSATFDNRVQSALAVNWEGSRRVLVVGFSHIFVLEIMNSWQLER